MLNYEINVEGVEIDGHPIAIFATNLHIAATSFDSLVKKYPYNQVRLSELVVNIVKESQPLARPLHCLAHKCDEGRTIDKQSVVVLGSNGKAYCRICGWKEN